MVGNITARSQKRRKYFKVAFIFQSRYIEIKFTELKVLKIFIRFLVFHCRTTTVEVIDPKIFQSVSIHILIYVLIKAEKDLLLMSQSKVEPGHGTA